MWDTCSGEIEKLRTIRHVPKYKIGIRFWTEFGIYVPTQSLRCFNTVSSGLPLTHPFKKNYNFCKSVSISLIICHMNYATGQLKPVIKERKASEAGQSKKS